MNILDKLSLATIGITIAAVAYDDVVQDLSDTFDGLFEAEASLQEKTGIWQKHTAPHEIIYCDEKGCNNIAFQAFNNIENKPQKPLKRYSKKDVKCLAANIYHEAGIEPLSGQLAVAFGTIQRVKDNRFPDSLCGVVYQKKQMSWTASDRKRSMSVPPLYHTIALDVLNAKYQAPNDCPATNWYNPIDRRGSFNERQFLKGKTTCTFTISRHTYIAYK